MQIKIKDEQILIAGFGGQGILFFGKIIAYAAMINGGEVSWLPSYGPEMRGGTCNCSVCISKEAIASPLIESPTVFIAMNRPSYDKFISHVQSGSIVFIDSSLINLQKEYEGIPIISVPAAALALENKLPALANMIMLGALIKSMEIATVSQVEEALNKCIPTEKNKLIINNMKAVRIGMDYI